MESHLTNQLVVIRGGGLGDFLLSIPVLFEACSRYQTVHLFTRPSYHQILGEKACKNLVLYDLDAELSNIKNVCVNADVISFWNDAEWIQELNAFGVRQIFSIDPRPSKGLHFTKTIFKALNWEFEAGKLNVPWLGDRWNSLNKTLWIHPGSGSTLKNRSFKFFKERAFSWLKNDRHNRVVFSFGEADRLLEAEILSSSVLKEKNVECMSCLSLFDFKNLLVQKSVAYLGNDSGPSHLAAMLGIPTEAHFVSTDSRVWRPLGPRVQLVGLQ